MANQGQQASRKRIVHQLDTPFSTISWPEIQLEDQDTILELLCDLLSPLGRHRRAYVKPSKGKRAARKGNGANTGKGGSEDAAIPAPPPISMSIDVGFNSITRNLQPQSTSNTKESQFPLSRQYSMIFVARGDQSSAFNCHFPQMVGVASKDLPIERKIRLVGISKPCSERLSACLGLPRVSSIAVSGDAPGAGALEEFVRKVVSPVTVHWLGTLGEAEYLPTKINPIETLVGQKKVRVE